MKSRLFIYGQLIYFATRYLDAGGDLSWLQLLLGHATLAMVLRHSSYVDTSKSSRRTPSQFDPLDRLVHGQANGRRWRY